MSGPLQHTPSGHEVILPLNFETGSRMIRKAPPKWMHHGDRLQDNEVLVTPEKLDILERLRQKQFERSLEPFVEALVQRFMRDGHPAQVYDPPAQKQNRSIHYLDGVGFTAGPVDEETRLNAQGLDRL